MPNATASATPFPRMPLLLIGGLVALALGIAISGPGTVGGTTPPPTAPGTR